MTTDISSATSDRQRSRAARRGAKSASSRGAAEPPRQRRPALAALALLLIVGGALVAGLLAVRVDSRVPVLVAARDIEPGAEITAEDVKTVNVASEGLNLVGKEHSELVVGQYAATRIPADALIDGRMVTDEPPIGEEEAIVSVPLAPKLTPADDLRTGDVVLVVRATGEAGGDGKAQQIATALVLSVSTTSDDDLAAAQQTASASLLVPAEAAVAVIDAASADQAGLALLERGQDTDYVPVMVEEAE